jgi:hypothetical protein
MVSVCIGCTRRVHRVYAVYALGVRGVRGHWRSEPPPGDRGRVSSMRFLFHVLHMRRCFIRETFLIFISSFPYFAPIPRNAHKIGLIYIKRPESVPKFAFKFDLSPFYCFGHSRVYPQIKNRFSVDSIALVINSDMLISLGLSDYPRD